MKTALTLFRERSHLAMTGTCPILLHISPELFGRMAARAAADRFDLHEWVLHTVIGELLRPEAELAANRRARAVIAAMPHRSSVRLTTERKTHAPHP